MGCSTVGSQLSQVFRPPAASSYRIHKTATNSNEDLLYLQRRTTNMCGLRVRRGDLSASPPKVNVKDARGLSGTAASDSTKPNSGTGRESQVCGQRCDGNSATNALNLNLRVVDIYWVSKARSKKHKMLGVVKNHCTQEITKRP